MDQNMSEERPTININSTLELSQIFGQIENQRSFTYHHDGVSNTSELIIIGCDGIEYHIHLDLDIGGLYVRKRKADEENEIVANKICKLSHDE